MPVKVLIYEDNTDLLKSIQTLFQWNDELDVVAGLPDAASVIRDIETYHPDVILMDIDMPPSNGVQALITLRQKFKELPVIMLTVFEDNDNIVNSICAGASGYLLKKDIEQLLPAIRDVLEGGAPMTSSVARKVLKLFPGKQEKKESTAGLTGKESEILQWLVRGYSYKMIAVEMKIGIETVRSHIKKIYRKLQVNSATEAVYKTTRDK
jgi:DNA-binding NarL/FixJ family response regulator